MEKNTIIKIAALAVIVAAAITFRKKLKRGVEVAASSIGFHGLNNDGMIEGLHPSIRKDAKKLVDEIEKEMGIKVKVVSTSRLEKDQNELYAKGRTTAQLREKGIKNIQGKPNEAEVTKAPFGQSYHNFGLAMDIVEVSPKNGYGKGYPDSRWQKIGAIAKSQGWEWGGDWKLFIDHPHVQKPKFGTLAQMRSKYASGKVDNNGFLTA